jgi:predicted GNAT family acetyltransferase
MHLHSPPTKQSTAALKWRIDYEVETLGYSPGPDVNARAHEAVTRMIASGDVWVATESGALVSMSAINARLPDMVQVGGVHTPKHLRGRGYARIAVAGSLLDCKSEGAHKAILFTEARNTAAQKVYAALGFQHIGDYGLVLLK